MSVSISMSISTTDQTPILALRILKLFYFECELGRLKLSACLVAAAEEWNSYFSSYNCLQIVSVNALEYGLLCI